MELFHKRRCEEAKIQTSTDSRDEANETTDKTDKTDKTKETDIKGGK